MLATMLATIFASSGDPSSGDRDTNVVGTGEPFRIGALSPCERPPTWFDDFGGHGISDGPELLPDASPETDTDLERVLDRVSRRVDISLM